MEAGSPNGEKLKLLALKHLDKGLVALETSKKHFEAYADTIKRRNNETEDIEDLQKMVIDGIAETMGTMIEIGNYGAVIADDIDCPYYICQFLSFQYSLQESTIVDGQMLHAGELVCDAFYLDEIGEVYSNIQKTQKSSNCHSYVGKSKRENV